MKKIFLLINVLLIAFSLNAQVNSLYIIKDGKVKDKYNLYTGFDSIVFYNPAENENEPQEGFSGIMPYSKNPFYWQYKGQPILLFGGSERDNIFHWANNGTQLTDHLDLLKSCGGNYIRCTMSSREYTESGYRWDILPYPYAKINGKYNLTVWDQVYWDNLKTFLTETQNRGIIVQIEVWDRWNESGTSATSNTGWFYSPFNPNNNVNYNWSDSPLLKTGQTGFYNQFHFAALSGDPVLLPIQQAFINKIIDIVIYNGFDHVLFQIDNESGIGDVSTEPDPYWANYIRTYANSKKPDHPIFICSQRRFQKPSVYITTEFKDWNNPDIQVAIMNPAFNYCDISQNNGNSGQTHYDNLIWYRSKVQENGARPINHIKCYHYNWPTGTDFNTGRTPASDEEALSKFWRAIFGGAASLRFHRDTPYHPGGLRDGLGLSPEAQTHLKSMNILIKNIDIFSMEPDNNLLSNRTENEAYCLAEPGKQYAVFFTGEGNRSVNLNLSSDPNQYYLRWLDVNNKLLLEPIQLQGNTNIILTPPAEGPHWVAILNQTALIAKSPIKPYSQNPAYWEFDGKPVFLFGGSEQDNLFQWENDDFTLEEQLDLVKECGGNYVRCTLSSRKLTPEGLRWNILPQPYEKVNDKFDLTKWNDVYWQRLYKLLYEAYKRDIIVQISIFDRWNEAGNASTPNTGWYDSPYNPNNNINYDWTDCPSLKKVTGFYNPFHLAVLNNDQILLNVQQKFVKKVIDLAMDNGFGNVLFQVDNDCGIGDTTIEPDPYWANFIRNYAHSKDPDYPINVCIQRRFQKPSVYVTTNFQDWNNPDARVPITNPAFNYYDISMNNGNTGQIQYDNFIWYRSKVHEYKVLPINNIKCFHLNWPTGTDFNLRTHGENNEALSKFWRLLFAGAASAHFPDSRQNSPTDLMEGFGLTEQGQQYLKGMNMFLGSANIFKMSPNNSLLSGRSGDEAYCLANPGNQYAVFFTGQGDKIITIELANPGVKYKVKWLDIKNRSWHTAQDVNGGIQTLSPPGSASHWAVILTNENN